MADDKLQELLKLGEGGSMTPTLRAKLSELAHDAMKLEERIEKGETLLKALKSELNKILMTDMPTILNSVQLKDFTTSDDIRVEVTTIVTGSLPKDEDRRREAITIIKSIGGEDLFTNDVNITFGKGEEEKAWAVLEAIGKLGFNHATMSQEVHPQTLCAFVREKMANGEPIEPEKLGVFVAPKAKVKQLKKKRGAR